MRGMKMIVCLLLLLSTGCLAASSLNVSNTLGSNMVLQREPVQAKVWGWAAAGIEVYVDFNSKQLNTTAAKDGSWIVTLPATKAGGPYSIVVSSSDGGKIMLSNVLFGEVWLCGGQSNMQFTVPQAFNATAEVAAANNYPNIRVMSVGTSHYSSTPLDQLYQNPQLIWSVASSASVGMGDWSAMSAVCWFTGRNLYDNLQVPIGLISSNWGGTVIQAWSSPTALKVCNVTTSGSGNEANSVLYNAMIYPFKNYQIAGTLWYQGEQNAGQAALYSCMFPAMINDWRSLWGYEFPFFFVQLAPFAAGSSSAWPDTREAQLNALKLNKVGFASAVDLGDPTSPYGDVHPRDKQDVGKRLAVAVRAIAYGQQLIWMGPTFSSAQFSQSGSTTKVTVNFKVPSGNLVFVNQTYPPTNIVPLADCSNWAYQLKNGTWIQTTDATLSGTSVIITISNQPQAVVGIAYAYASWPITTLFSEQKLPAIPFKYVVS